MSNLSTVRANELMFHQIQVTLSESDNNILKNSKLVYLWNNQFVTFDAFPDKNKTRMLSDKDLEDFIDLPEQITKSFVLHYLSEKQLNFSDVEFPNQLHNVHFVQSDLSFDVISVDDSQQFTLISIQ